MEPSNEYKSYLQAVDNEYGEVVGINFPIITVRGLPNITLGEMVVFEDGERGEAMALIGDVVKVLLFSKRVPQIGAELTRTQTTHTIEVDTSLLGTVVNSLGEVILSLTPRDSTQTPEQRPTHHHPLLLSQRSRIQKQLISGVGIVDLLLPLGAGQRELIVGDRKTGKSIFLLTHAIHQARQNKVVIYCVIGQPKGDLQNLLNTLVKEKVERSVVVVASTAEDPASLIYKTPDTALTIAEFFRDAGVETLVILDDLTTHAKMYREVALLAREFPGRDSYPADIFHIHARLLERAGSFRHVSEGSVAISCLPVAETVENNLTDYIVSNLISITDGHLLFDSTEFAKGRRPPINFGLSITRVGKQVQTTIAKELTQRLANLLIEYNRFETFSRFGSDLNETAQKILTQGKQLLMFLNQVGHQPLEYNTQLLLATCIEQGWWNSSDDSTIASVKQATTKALATQGSVKTIFEHALQADSYSAYVSVLNRSQSVITKLWPKPKS